MMPQGMMNPMPTYWPPIDVWEEPHELVVRAEMPGMELKDVEVTLADDMLTIRGERRLEHQDKKTTHFHRVEGVYGTFTRTFSLPTTVDREKIKATMKHGVLEIHAPKREPTKGKVITITG
jgi:HSP20 family protein